MKISTVSKKVLASALSAAMVVAFAPTVAFGAVGNGNKVRVDYDLGLGVDIADSLNALQLTGNAITATGNTITLANSTYVGMYPDANNNFAYDFTGWKLYYDANGDGDYEDTDADDFGRKDINGAEATTGTTFDVSGSEYYAVMTLTAVAQYDVSPIKASLTPGNFVDYAKGELRINIGGIETSKIANASAAKVVVTCASGTYEKAVSKLAGGSYIDVPVAADTFKVELVDGDGHAISSDKVIVGELIFTGAYMKDITNADRTWTKTQTLYYVATGQKMSAADAYRAADEDAAEGHDGYSYKKLDEDGNGEEVVDYWYDNSGAPLSEAQIAKNTLSTTFTAAWNSDDVQVRAISYKDNEVAVVLGGIAADNSKGKGLIAAADVASVKNPATAAKSGYYVVVKDATAKKAKTTLTYKSQVSASGSLVTYAKVSGNAKITVGAAGKVTLKKVTKDGTYKAKVLVACGEQTRTVTVKFVVTK